jgi:hypothetical protein
VDISEVEVGLASEPGPSRPRRSNDEEPESTAELPTLSRLSDDVSDDVEPESAAEPPAQAAGA